ncbi:hypothetical protein BD324DRAFT_368924 [Kockovaella imperatae]|uniref:Uncharacterized protein n=1 Tax=Kockovaella imperatae TaxID=4999 RepID=A0A1Y1UKM8_9TREE|nr:hypothetical protein BD324DRAFT_368924 [Kockovaella imperatae]ORX38598.1 hypothetical protein BD324DRAFT_368924 [Kockovaella imperatae]
MPRNAADFEVTQIPVHRSQPVASPLISARTSEAGPAWQLARDARSADCLPKPSLPTNAKSQMHSRIEPKEDGAVSTGASVTSNWPLAVSPHERRRTSVATSIGNDTFETAEGSPLLPSRSISRATVVPEMRDSPSDMTPFEQPAPDTYARNPSPRPSILINGKGKDRQFREWIFPLHGPRPSISRRHTAPTDLPLKVSDQHHDETLGPAIASTSFDERIETLWNHTAPRRAISPASDPGVLGTGEDTAYPSSSREREASIEFPMRTPNKVLRVINEVDHHPIGALHLPATTDKSDPERVEVMMGDCPRCQVPPSRAGDESVGLLADREEAMPEEGCHALNNLSAVPQGLNDDLFDAVARTQLPPSLMVETSEASAAAQRQHDYEAQEMFQAMLTGQHTMLEKLAELTISRDELLLVVETVRLEQAQLKHLVAKHASTEKEIAALKSQLEALQSRNEELVTARAEAASEAGIHQSRLEDARQDCNALRADMAHQLSKLESSEARGRDQRAENDALLSDKLAAERERDALGKTLLETREELREVANQLRVSQETTETVS